MDSLPGFADGLGVRFYSGSLTGLTVHDCDNIFKVADRRAALQLQNFKKPSDKSLWEQLMKTDYMSSEESDVDGEEDILKVHDLPWRKPAVKKMFATLDAESTKRKTAQSKRQMKRRVTGSDSARSRPASVPKWAAKLFLATDCSFT